MTAEIAERCHGDTDRGTARDVSTEERRTRGVTFDPHPTTELERPVLGSLRGRGQGHHDADGRRPHRLHVGDR
jgi:hypothetical protein